MAAAPRSEHAATAAGGRESPVKSLSTVALRDRSARAAVFRVRAGNAGTPPP